MTRSGACRARVRIVNIRRATQDDVPEIVRLKALLMIDGWPFDIELDDAWRERCARVARQLLASDGYACFVIDRVEGAGPGSPLASCVTATVEQHLPGPDGSGRSAYVGDMCTDAEFRGRGCGTALLSTPHCSGVASRRPAGSRCSPPRAATRSTARPVSATKGRSSTCRCRCDSRPPVDDVARM